MCGCRGLVLRRQATPPCRASRRPRSPLRGRVRHRGNVGSNEEVDDVMAGAAAAGGSTGRPAGTVQSGYVGYFADPDGHLWKVAAGS